MPDLYRAVRVGGALPARGGAATHRDCLNNPGKGYLAHKKQHFLPRNTIGPQAYAYCSVLEEALVVMSEVPMQCIIHNPYGRQYRRQVQRIR